MVPKAPMEVMTFPEVQKVEVHMHIEPVGAVPAQQAQSAVQHAHQTAPVDGDGDHDGSPSAGSLPEGSTTSNYA